MSDILNGIMEDLHPTLSLLETKLDNFQLKLNQTEAKFKESLKDLECRCVIVASKNYKISFSRELLKQAILDKLSTA